MIIDTKELSKELNILRSRNSVIDDMIKPLSHEMLKNNTRILMLESLLRSLDTFELSIQ